MHNEAHKIARALARVKTLAEALEWYSELVLGHDRDPQRDGMADGFRIVAASLNEILEGECPGLLRPHVAKYYEGLART